MSKHHHNRPLTEVELRVKALESLLTEKGLIDPAAVDEIIETYEHKVGPATAPGWWRAPGSIRTTSSVC
jgi:Nitrile hydratase, alpha chain